MKQIFALGCFHSAGVLPDQDLGQPVTCPVKFRAK